MFLGGKYNPRIFFIRGKKRVPSDSDEFLKLHSNPYVVFRLKGTARKVYARTYSNPVRGNTHTAFISEVGLHNANKRTIEKNTLEKKTVGGKRVTRIGK